MRARLTLLSAVFLLAFLLPGCGGDGTTEPENRAPSATISAPEDGDTFVEGTEVTLEGSADDPDEGSLSGSSLAWESDLDGGLGSGTRVTVDDLSTGDHTITLTATDRQGATGTASVDVTVEPNDPPTASVSAPQDGSVFGQGAPVTFQGSASDPQEGSLEGDALSWSSDLDGELGTGDELTLTDLSVGDHQVTLTATDPQGATGTDDVSVTVEANGQPSAQITSPSDDASFTEGQTIQFRGSGSDPEDGSLTGGSLVWRSDVDGELGTGEAVDRDDLSSGPHTITLTATDSRNASTADSIGITVEGSPSVTIDAPADETIFQEGDAVGLEGTATDPTEGALSGSSLVWRSDVDGELGTGATVSTSSLSQGPHVITLTATDSDGNTGSASVALLVESPGFDIRVRFEDPLSPAKEQVVRDALQPWEQVITGDLAPGFVDASSQCLTEDEGVDDLLVIVRVQDIDGSGGTLARAGPCLVRLENGVFALPISGVVTLDVNDLDNDAFEEVVTHEVGHVLGVGIEGLPRWGDNTRGLDTNDPFFDGSGTRTAFEDLDGRAYLSDPVPLANTGGPGTRSAHWREDNFENELMTGFVGAAGNPLSRVTVAALGDMGYQVNLDAAESYTLPMPQPALWEAEADATLSSPASSGENFGGTGTITSVLDTVLVVGANDDTWTADPAGEVLSSLIRFGVPSLPGDVTITGAELLLRRTGLDDDGAEHDVEVSRVTSSWDEGTVTGGSSPSVAGSPAFTFSFDACTGCFLGSSSTAFRDLVRGWSSGSTSNHGISLRAPDAETDSTFSVGFTSRHSGGIDILPRIRVRAQVGSMVRQEITGTDRRAIPLGDDIRPGMMYGVDAQGRILMQREIRRR